MTEEEAIILWPKINSFFKENSREPNIDSTDQLEKKNGRNYTIFKKNLKRKMGRSE